MLETLLTIDQAVFFYINTTLANPVTDFVMPVVTSDMLLRVLYLIALILIGWKGDSRLRWTILFSLLVLLAADQLSSSVLKPWIGRLRPCHALDGVHLLVGCGGGKSMPSSHAANAFAQAVFYAVLYRSIAKYLIPFAAIVALSRVFVGVHYPGDILGGAILGAAVGTTGAVLYRLFVVRKYPEKTHSQGGLDAGAA